MVKTKTIALWIVCVVVFFVLVEFFRALGQEPNGLPVTLLWDDPNPPGIVASYNVLEKHGTNWALVHTTFTNKASFKLSPGLHQLAVTAVGVGGYVSEKSAQLDLGVVLAVINLTVSQP